MYCHTALGFGPGSCQELFKVSVHKVYFIDPNSVIFDKIYLLSDMLIIS